jgi:hypothetical protein
MDNSGAAFHRRQEFKMSSEWKKAMGLTTVLILLGIIALLGGTKWVVVLIPIAVLIWQASAPILRNGRN